VIVNPAMMKADGSGPVRHLDMDTRAFGWKPLFLLFALVLATPLPLGRRMSALLWGSLCQQGFVMLALGFCIWQESSEIGLVSLSAADKEAAMGVRSLLTGQLAVAVPVLIWVLVTFRRGDFEKMTQQTGLTESPQSRQNAPGDCYVSGRVRRRVFRSSITRRAPALISARHCRMMPATRFCVLWLSSSPRRSRIVLGPLAAVSKSICEKSKS